MQIGYSGKHGEQKGRRKKDCDAKETQSGEKKRTRDHRKGGIVRKGRGLCPNSCPGASGLGGEGTRSWGGAVNQLRKLRATNS